MNRKGFSLLMMSFNNTKKILQWKMRFIDAFDAMEEQLKKSQFTLPDFTNPIIAARAWADECEKLVRTLLVSGQNREGDILRAFKNDYANCVSVKINSLYLWTRQGSTKRCAPTNGG